MMSILLGALRDWRRYKSGSPHEKLLAVLKFSGLRFLKQQGGAIVVTASNNGTRMFSNTEATACSCTQGQRAFWLALKE